MTDQGFQIQAPIRHQLEHGFKVSLLGPPHISQRIILPLLLILRVVAPGPVGAGHLKTQLFLVKICAGQLKPCNAHQNDPAAFAAHMGRLSNRIIALGRRGDNHGINPAASGPLLSGRYGIHTRRQIHCLSAELARHGKPAPIKVQAQHSTTLRLQQLDSQQANQAQPTNNHGLADCRLRKTDPLQADSRNDSKGCLLVGHLLWNPSTQIRRNGHIF